MTAVVVFSRAVILLVFILKNANTLLMSKSPNPGIITEKTSFVFLSAHQSGSSAPISTESTSDIKSMTRRKGHTNKYETFSKKKIDPLLKLIEVQQKTAMEESQRTKTVIRGTTVPTQKRAVVKLATTSKISKETKSSEFDISVSKNTSKPLFTPAEIRTVQPSDPYTFGYAEVGKILKSHGVRGELKFYATADNIDDLWLGSGSVVYVKKPSRRTPRPVQLTSFRKQTGNQYLLSLDRVDTRDLAEGFRDYGVFIKKEQRSKLSDDEYMIRDLVGLSCYKLKCPGKKKGATDKTLEIEPILSSDYKHEVSVGVVEGVVPPDELCSPEMAKLMHSMIEIRFHHNDELCLIPLVPAIVRHVDLSSKLMVIDPPEGLLDLTYSEAKKYVLRGYLPAICESVTDELRRQLMSATMFVDTLPPLIPPL